MNMSDAIDRALAGKMIARSVWDYTVVILIPSHYDGTGEYHESSFIIKNLTTGKFKPWAPTKEDALAGDWVEVQL